MTITVDANLFRLVSGAVSTEETRYYLNGVHIEPHPGQGAILVSTDGHRMIVAHDDKATCDESAIVSLPRYVLSQCKPPKMFTTKRRLNIVAKYPGSATIEDVTPGKKPEDEPKIEAVMTAHRVIIDGTFPDWRRVVPHEAAKPGAANPAAFNSKYLKEWGLLGVEISKLLGGNPEMQIALSDGGSPTVIRWGAPNIFAIQMPMRSNISGYLPAFMASADEFKEAAE